MKVLLVLVDGMRPDALTDIPEAQALINRSAYAIDAQTVLPSVTLPCHMSLFHSVNPDRHGTTTNIYAPQVRPIKGLCEVLRQHGKRCAFFYNWEELRDLTRPDSLAFSYFVSGHQYDYEDANCMLADMAVKYMQSDRPDFAFLYFGWPDAAGHNHGWGSEEYQRAMKNTWKDISRVIEALPNDYTVIVTADHGGHDRTHGTDLPEDMTIPVILCGEDFVPGEVPEDVSIKDIAPTVTALLGVEPDREWEGSSLLRNA